MDDANWRELAAETEHRRAYRPRCEVEADPTTLTVDPERLRLALLGYRFLLTYGRIELSALWYQKPPDMKLPHKWRILDLRAGVSRITSEEFAFLRDILGVSASDLADPGAARISDLQQKVERLADLALAHGVSGADLAKVLT